MGIFSLFKKKKKGTNFSKQLTSNVVKSMKQSSNISYEPPSIDPLLKSKLEIGLSPGEILLIKWLDNKVEPLSFPKYFTMQYGLNPARSLKHLAKIGYIQNGDRESALKAYKVAELKEKLEVKNLPVSGKKAELIQRLSDNLTDAEISSLPVSYALTQSGRDALKSYDYIIQSHSDRYFPVVDAILFKSEFPSAVSYGDLKWSYLNQKLNINIIDNNYKSARFVLLGMAEQLYYENKPMDALAFYLSVQILDCTGISGNVHYYENISFAPGILEAIKKCNHLISDDQYETCFNRAVDMLRGMRNKGFVTSQDLLFLKHELRKPRITVLKQHFSKYKKYTIKHQLGI